MLKKAPPISILGIGIGLTVNSIKYYLDAQKQVVTNTLFSQSIFWFILLLLLGSLAIGYSIGLSSSKHEDESKTVRRTRRKKS